MRTGLFALLLVSTWVVLSGTLQYASGQTDIASRVVVADLYKDYDGNGQTDRLGEHVTLHARVSLGKMMSPRFNSAYIQDASGGIRVDDQLGLGEVIYGDSVRVSGVLKKSGRTLYIDLDDVAILSTDRTILPEVETRGKDPNLTPYVGRVATVEGYVVSKAADSGGTYLLINRKGGPVAVRIDNRSPRSVAWTSSLGDYVRATGVLDHYREDDPFSYQLYTRSDSDLDRVLFPPPMYPWVGGVAAGLLAFILLSLGKRLKGTLRSRERQYKALFEQVGVPMVVADANLKIIDANKAACRLLRQSRTQIRFRRLKQFLKLAEGEDVGVISERLKVGSIESFVAGVWSEEVGEVEVEVILSRVRFGRNEFLVSTLHDVSRHMESINEFRRFHEDLVNGVPLEVSVLTPSGKYVYANERVGFGDLSSDWLVGKSDLELCRRLGIPTDVALRRRAHRRRAVSSEEVIEFEEEIEFRNETRCFLRSYQPVAYGPSGEVAAVASYAVDITELRESRRRLDNARGEIDKVGQLKEAFLENIDQEFRKPITGIIGFAEILQGEVSDEQREFVTLIERNGRRLMNTLNAVLDLAGLSNNEFDLDPQVLNIVDEIKQLIDESRSSAEEKGLFLKIEASESEILTRADQACLARVVQSLVDNSIKYTDAGGVIVEIDQDDDKVNIRVLDTGTGTGETMLPSAIDEIVRPDLDSGWATRSTGIGLGITMRLVELMNGTIEMESDREGSMLLVSLPRAFPKIGRDSSELPRLLLAEDSVDVHMMVRYVLQDHFRIEIVEDIESLYRHTRRSNFDVILVDLGLAGYRTIVDTVDKIRTRRVYRNVPVVALEEQGRRTDQQQVLKDGFDYFLGKPYRRQELVNLLSRVMAERIAAIEEEDDDLHEDLGDDLPIFRKSA